MAENEVHLKVYPIEIYHTFDDSSGVEDLYIYGQPTASIINTDVSYTAPDFESASIVGVLRHVGNLPCKALETVYTTNIPGENPVSIKITYHDNSIGSIPEIPTEDGTTGGWHVNATSSANWISQKLEDNYGKSFWSEPIDVSTFSIPDGQTKEVNIKWKGLLDGPPNYPYFDWVYKDINTGIIYQFDEATRVWQPFLMDGRDDIYGTGSWYHPPFYDKDLLRDSLGYPESSPEFSGATGHGPFNRYTFKFNTYISGQYYYFWVRAKDTQGNLELLNSTDNQETNSRYIPLITTAQPLVDSEAPEFNGTEPLNDIYAEGAYYYFTGPDYLSVSPNGYASLMAWAGSRRILHFMDGTTPHSRYIDYINWDDANKRVQITISDSSGLGSNLTEVFLTDITSASAGIGKVELNIPKCDDSNLSGFLIYRRNLNLMTPSTDGETSYEHTVGLTNSYEYVDFGLTFIHDDMQLPENQKFQYKIIPVSKYTTDGQPFNEDFSNIIHGKASFNAIPEMASNIGTIDDVETYYPSSGIAPLPIILNYADGSGQDEWYDKTVDGEIKLKWCRDKGATGIVDQDGDQPLVILDVNNDVKGFHLERAREEKIGVGNWELGAWQILAQSNYESFPSSDNGEFEHSFLDFGLDTYNINGEVDTTSPTYKLVRYQYRIRAFDYGGNAGEWSYFNEPTRSIIPTDEIPPDTSQYNLKVMGVLGGWNLEFVDHNNDTTQIEIQRQHVDGPSANTILPYNGNDTNIIGLFDVASTGVVYAIDTVAPPTTGWYGRFQVRGKDKNDNWTDWWPAGWTTPVTSLTLTSAVDVWPPKDPTNVSAVYQENEGRVEVSWTMPDEENVLDQTPIDLVSGSDITVNGAIWETDEYIGKFVRIIAGTGTSTWGEIITNDSNTITVSAWNGTPPDATSEFEIYGSPLTDLDGIHINKIQLNETDVLTAGVVTGSTSTTLTAAGETWSNDSFNGYYVKITDGYAKGTIGKISDTINPSTLNIESWVGSTPSVNDTFSIFYGSETFIQTAGDTNSNLAEVFYDYNVGIGSWQYSIYAYDRSGNQSGVVSAEYITNIGDTLPPPIPVIQFMIGGSGTLQFKVSDTIAEPISYYEFYIKDKNGKSIFTEDDGFYQSDTRSSNEYYKKSYGSILVVFNVSDTKYDVSRYSVKAIAVDINGNRSLTTDYVEVCTTFLDTGLPLEDPYSAFYAPAGGVKVYDKDGIEISKSSYDGAPENYYCKAYLDDFNEVSKSVVFDVALPSPDTTLLSNDTTPRPLEYTYTDLEGNVFIRIGTGVSGHRWEDVNRGHEVAKVVVYRRIKPFGGTYEDWGYFGTEMVLAYDATKPVWGVHFNDMGINNHTVQYRIHPVSKANILDVTGVEIPEIAAIDVTGFDLDHDHDDFNYNDFHNLVWGSTVPDYGKLRFWIPDVLDSEISAYFEIFRTPYKYQNSTPSSPDTGSTPWSVTNFYDNRDATTHLLPLGKTSGGNDAWERVDVIPSTPGYNPNAPGADGASFEDNDWSMAGDIENSSYTKFSNVEYQNAGMYAIVATDKWGNRGKPYFVGGVSAGNAASQCWLNMPAWPFLYDVEIKTSHVEIRFDKDNLLSYPLSSWDLIAKPNYGNNIEPLSNPYFRWEYNDDPNLATSGWTPCEGQLEGTGVSNNTFSVDPAIEDWLTIAGRTYRVTMYASFDDAILAAKYPDHDPYTTDTQAPYTLSNDADPLAQDTQSIIKSLDGEVPIYAVLSKDSVVVPTDEDGTNPNLTAASTTMNIYQGLTDISYQFDVTSSDNGTGTTSITPGVSGTTPHTFTMTALDDADNIVTISLTADRDLVANPLLLPVSISKDFVVSKLHHGEGAKFVKTNVTSHLFNKLIAAVPDHFDPDTITASVEVFGFTAGSYQWKRRFYNTGSWGSWINVGADQATYDISPTDFPAGSTLMQVSCEVTDSNILNTDTYEDPTDIAIVTGGSGFSITLTNSTINIPCDQLGEPIETSPFTSFYTDVIGFHNNESLTYNDTDTSKGNFKISSITDVPSSIEYSVNTSTGRISITNVLSDDGYLDITFATTIEGNIVNVKRRLNIHKAYDAYDARYVHTEASSETFLYPKKLTNTAFTPTPSSILFNVLRYNIDDVKSYQWEINNEDTGWVPLNGTITNDNYTLAATNPAIAGVDNFSVRCVVTDNYDDATFYDEQSITKLYQTSGYTAILENENISVPCANDLTGAVLTDAITNTQAFDGTTELVYDSDNGGVEAGQEYGLSLGTATDCTASIVGNDIQITSIDDLVKTANVKVNFHFDSQNEIIITKILNIIKAPEGHEAKYTRTVADDGFVYSYPRKLPTATATPTPTSLTFSAVPYGIEPIVTYLWQKKIPGSGWVSAGSAVSTFTLDHTDFAGDVIQIRCEVSNNLTPTEKYYDPITVHKVYDGSGYTAIVSNENMSIPCDADLKNAVIDPSIHFSYLTAYADGVKLDWNANPEAGNGFYVTHVNSTGVSSSEPTSYTAKVGKINVTALDDGITGGYIDLTFQFDANNEIQIDKRITINKAIPGYDGLHVEMDNENHTIKMALDGTPVDGEINSSTCRALTNIRAYYGDVELTEVAGSSPTIGQCCIYKDSWENVDNLADSGNQFYIGSLNNYSIPAKVVFAIKTNVSGTVKTFYKTWSINTQIDGDAPFTSTVFKRGDENFNTTPTAGAGNFDSPYPDPLDGWSDGIPAAPADGYVAQSILYSSHRIFTKSGLAPQEASWSAPKALTNTDSFEVQYSDGPPSDPNLDPGDPDPGNAANGATWSSTPSTSTVWMATQVTKNHFKFSWKVLKIKGEAAPTVLAQYSVTGSGSPLDIEDNGWSPTYTAGDEWIIFSYDNGVTWGDPQKFLGDSGKWPYMWFARSVNTPTKPAQSETTPDNTTWFDAPPSGSDPLWMTKNEYDPPTDSMTDVWSDPVRISGYDGESTFKSVVFKRQPKPAPSAPSGGTYAVPVPNGWSDGVPSGTDLLWMSTRIFAESANEPPQQSTWTTPQQASSNSGIEIQYSDTGIGNPSTNDTEWDPTPTVNSVWMAVRTLDDDGWSNWTITKIKGEKGDTGDAGVDGVSGTASRLDIAYAMDGTGTGVSYPSGTLSGGYTPANSSGKTWVGTNVVTWDSSGSETPASSTHGDYEWSQFVGDDGTDGGDGYTNRIDIAYGTADGGGTVSYPSGKLSLDNYTAASPVGKNWIGTNVITWRADLSEPTVSTTSGDYEWTKFVGEDGADGVDGLNGADGVDGNDGVSIVWQGDYASHPANPQDGWAYYNTVDGKSYVYQSGAWYQMTIDGVDGLNGVDGNDGVSIVWQGESSDPPANPQLNWSYRDTDNGYIYIWTGSAWELMVHDGSNGTDGTNGVDGGDGLSVYITYHDNATTSQPSKPTSISGTDGGWHTAATAAANWMSQKLDDGISPTSTAWSNAIQITGDKGDKGDKGDQGDPADALQIQYSIDDGATDPYEGTYALGDKYMRTSSDGGATWSTGQLFVGETGVEGPEGPGGTYVSIVFIRSVSTPSTPTGSSDPPVNWSDVPPSGSDPLYMSKATFNYDGTLNVTWSGPQRITGDDGKSGNYKEYAYKQAPLASTPTVSGTSIPPSGWSLTPPVIMDKTEDPAWSTTGTVDGVTGNLIGSWSNPTLWSALGSDGTPADNSYGTMVYIRSSSQPANVTGTYPDELLGGWSASIPDSNGLPVWSSSAVLDQNGDPEGGFNGWSTPTKMTEAIDYVALNNTSSIATPNSSTQVANKVAPSQHLHTISQVTGLQDALNAAGNFDSWTVEADSDGLTQFVVTDGAKVDFKSGSGITITADGLGGITISNNLSAGDWRPISTTGIAPTAGDTTSISASWAYSHLISSNIHSIAQITDLQTNLDGKQSSHSNLTSLAGLSYSQSSFVKMTGANTFTLDTNTYATTEDISGLASESWVTFNFDKYEKWKIASDSDVEDSLGTQITSNGGVRIKGGNFITTVGTSNTLFDVVTINHNASAFDMGNALTGATVIDQIIDDGYGHLNVISTRELTASDVGAQPSGSYDNYEYWSISADTGDTEGITPRSSISVVGGGDVSTNFDQQGNILTITCNDNNTWRDVSSTPVDNATDVSISSEWAYEHSTDGGAHDISAINGLQTTLNGKLDTSLKGANNGLAELDINGLVPSSQLPGFVDDVLEYNDFSSLPVSGSSGKIYVTKDNNKTYRWGGSSYVEISSSLALGETNTTAYRGDRGASAYMHSIESTGNPHNVTANDIGLANVENVALSTWTGSSAITNLGTISSGTVPWVNISNKPTYDNYVDWVVSDGTNTESIQGGTSLLIEGTGAASVTVDKNLGYKLVIDATNTVYTHPSYSNWNISTTNAEVLSTFTSNSTGHVTGITTRTMTLANLGYTGATDADKYAYWKLADQNDVEGGGTTINSTNQVRIKGDKGITTEYSSGTLTVNHPDFAETDIGPLTGGLVIDKIIVDNGHISSFTTRELTASDVGAQSYGSYDNYISWDIEGDSGTPYGVVKDTLVHIKGGSYITTSQSNSVITINNNAPNVTTNLGQSLTTTTVTITSSDGTNTTLNGAGTNAGIMTASDKTKLNGIATNADKYTSWTVSSGTADDNQDTIISGERLTVEGGTGGVTTALSGGTLTINAIDTVYTHPTYTARNIDTSGASVLDILTVNTLGHVTAASTRTMTLANLGYTGATNANYYGGWNYDSGSNSPITVSSGDSVSVEGSRGITTSHTGGTITIAHGNYSDTSLNTSGAEVIQSITISEGHINSIVTRNITASDVGAQPSGSYDNYSNWKISADGDAEGVGALVTTTKQVRIKGGNALNTSRVNETITVNHDDTSTFSMSTLTNAWVISDITVDGYGHTTNVTTRELTASDVGAQPSGSYDNYSNWKLRDDSGNVVKTINSTNELAVEGSGATSVSWNGTSGILQISSTDNNTWRNIDTSPVLNQNSESISSGWAYNHEVDNTGAAHIIAGVSGLQSALDGKSNTGHTHNYDNYSNWKISADSDGEGVGGLITTLKTMRISGGTGITTSRSSGVVTINSTVSSYTHPTYTARNIDTSGASVLDILTVNTLGHVTAASTRTMTLANLGYTGATNANYYGDWNLKVDGSHELNVTNAVNVDFVAGTGISLAFDVPSGNKLTITNTSTNTWRSISSTPTSGATTTSISSHWAYNHLNSASVHQISDISSLQSTLDDKYESGDDVSFNKITATNWLKITGTLKTAGAFYAGTTNPSSSTRLNYDGYLYPTRVYNAFFSDIADYFIDNYGDIPEPGYCYYIAKNGKSYKTKKYLQEGITGIISDTYGFALGKDDDKNGQPIALAGYVLAHVKEKYLPGTLLTSGKNGILQKMKKSDIRNNPDKIVATFIKEEKLDKWGKVKVNGRCWVKV